MGIDHIFYYWCTAVLLGIGLLGGWWYSYFRRPHNISYRITPSDQYSALRLILPLKRER